ncbi:uncharacterized protein N7443_006089 [Penicillium atrosanguineum]|uniref:uncharacterized protein n=1 Tax=Penicillium atrosanguineum TaxID=1132637 RepID=UPI0023928438|nr:uncharacterized protein N7443_006089 [Penicillium atrosanguineum]KAJ5128974.1 hypothetical protein N7526_007140 [Penicillium atrosanguineum]KAJ5301087.1 hypothetical protein N7443_006089 [Penicillium atrosanguineum]
MLQMFWKYGFLLVLPRVIKDLNQAAVDTFIVVPKSTPSNALFVPADFFGFGFESGFLPYYNNDFSRNVVTSIQARMSQPLVIRVGGTSGDNITVHQDQKEASHCTSDRCNSLSHFDIGLSYFDTFTQFPNASWTVQAPMGVHFNITNTMTYLRHAWNAIGKDRVSAIALGNEPNWYPMQDKSYDYAAYTKDAIEIEDRVIKDFALEGDDRRIFQVGEIASEAVSSDFNLLGILQGRLGRNGRTKYAAEHFYQHAKTGVAKSYFTVDVLQDFLMSHADILGHLLPYAKVVDWIKEKKRPYSLVLSEVGSAIGGSPISFGGGFGAAIWAVDFHLASMSRGVKRICNTMGPDSTHSFWLPSETGRQPTGPAVQGIFPSAAFIADFVGRSDTLGKVSNLTSNFQYLSAYAMYNLNSDKPTRVALINLREWHESDTPALSPTRGFYNVTLRFGDGLKTVTVKRMHSESGSLARGFDQGGHRENVTWAGEQWSYKVDKGKGHFVSGLQEEKLNVNQGSAHIIVHDTEAVMVFLS